MGDRRVPHHHPEGKPDSRSNTAMADWYTDPAMFGKRQYFVDKNSHILIKLLSFLTNFFQTQQRTRMHSSRMRTVRCSGRRVGGERGVSGGCLPGGVCLEGCLPGERGVSAPVHGGVHTPLPLWREWQTPVKTNYVADGKNRYVVRVRLIIKQIAVNYTESRL